LTTTAEELSMQALITLAAVETRKLLLGVDTRLRHFAKAFVSFDDARRGDSREQ